MAEQAADLHTSAIDQAAAAVYLRAADLDGHVQTLRDAYRLRRDAMVSALPGATPPGSRWSEPDGGMFTWVRLPGDVDTAKLLPAALEHEVAFAYRMYVTSKAQTDRGLVEAGRGGGFGAFVDGRLVAQMSLVAAGPDSHVFQAVETDADRRRQGPAGSLVHHASRYGFAELGARTLVMVADPNYFAISPYRAPVMSGITWGRRRRRDRGSSWRAARRSW